MAKKVVGLEVTVDTPQADASVKSLRAQLKEAQADVVNLSEKFGQTSKEAQEAAKRAAALKDSIGDAKDLVDAFNPDAKFKAFGQAVGGVTGGFAALQGALGLVGVESESVEKSLLKVQSALALSQGIDQVLEAKDSFLTFASIIKDKVVTAFTTLRGAIIATGIGALVVVVGLLIANFEKIKDALSGLTPAQKAYNNTLEDYKKGAQSAIENTNKVEVAFRLAKKGVISKDEALATYNQTLGDTLGNTNSLEEAEANYNAKAATYVKAMALRAQANAILAKSAEAAAKGTTAGLEDQTTILDKLEASAVNYLTGNAGTSVGIYLKNQSKRVKEIKDQAESEAKVLNDLGTKLLEEAAIQENKVGIKQKSIKQKVNSDAKKVQKDESKKTADEEKEAQKRLAEELRLAALSEFDKDVANLNKQKLERIKIANGQKDLLLKIEADYQKQLADIKKKRATITISGGEIETVEAEDPKKKMQEDAKTLLDQANSEQFSFEQRLAKLQEREDLASKIVFDNEEARTAFTKENADTRIKIAEDEASEKIKQLQRGAALLSNISELVGKETAAGKAAAVASATIDTYAAAWSAFKAAQKNPISILGPAYPYIQAGLAVAGGIANIKKIIAVKVPNGGGGGGGGNLPSAPPISAAQNAPLPPQADTTQLNQASINAVGNASSRAYVLDSDITNNRDRITRLNRAARIN
jgi:hypothetical protein